MPTDPLQLPLRDIHLPGDVSMWPLAYGWWILIVIIAATAIASWLWYKRVQAKKIAAITLARNELILVKERLAANGDPKHIVNELSILLRRLSISTFPRIETASLTGNAWLSFLDEVLHNKSFESEAGKVLIEGPYRPKVLREDVEPLISLCDKWIDAVHNTQGARG
jgi:hypothetical protein